MKQPKPAHLLPILLIAAVLTVLSGLATQLCQIGHGPVIPVAILAPYAALMILAGFGALAVWIAVLQFPLYTAGLLLSRARGTLTVATVVVLLVHCVAVVVAIARLF